AQVRLVGTPVAGTDGAAPEEAEFAASGNVITFPGFLRAYVEGSDDPEADLSEREVQLPPLAVGDTVEATAIEPRSHTTQPPARYTEASLVKNLEELGVGRPSTYASILGTIQERGYVWKKGSALVPSFTAFAVVGLLEQYFSNLVDYGFTAAMEDDLDEIAQGAREALPWLTRFYFGETGPAANGSGNGNRNANGKAAGSNGDGGESSTMGLKSEIALHLGEIDAREVNSIPIGEDAEGRAVVARVGRYGPYLQREDDRASIPEDLPPDELTLERAEELLAAPSGDRVLGDHPDEGLPVIARTGRFGPYVQLGEVVDGGDKPRTASLFKTMGLDTVTLEQALQLLQLPRVVGNDPGSDEEILALNGRFGPYLKRGTDTRSLATEEELFTVTLDQALALFAEPKRGRGRTAAAPIKELGTDPETEQPIVLRAGRFGPYVTDGTTNASLRQGDDQETITHERAVELLADRRAAGPPKKRVKKAAKAKKAAKRTTKAAGATRATAKATKAAKAGKTTKAAPKAGPTSDPDGDI
ncbi:MAG: topoisomerase C-terminal repeat-containing protein, partial [Acidimicrobiales bacterium]